MTTTIKYAIIYEQSILYRGVEQMVARRAHNPKVVGSNPAPATIIFQGNEVISLLLNKNVIIYILTQRQSPSCGERITL